MVVHVRRIILLLTLAMAVLTASVTAAPARASAAGVGGTRGAVTVNCSWGSCSYYLSRSATKEVNSRIDNYMAGGGAISGGVCLAIGAMTAVVGGVICGVGAAIGAGHAWVIRDQVKEAAETHGSRGACFKVTRSHAGTLWYSTNNGKFCKN
jgi:hypothetical protein